MQTFKRRTSVWSRWGPSYELPPLSTFLFVAWSQVMFQWYRLKMVEFLPRFPACSNTWTCLGRNLEPLSHSPGLICHGCSTFSLMVCWWPKMVKGCQRLPILEITDRNNHHFKINLLRLNVSQWCTSAHLWTICLKGSWLTLCFLMLPKGPWGLSLWSLAMGHLTQTIHRIHLHHKCFLISRSLNALTVCMWAGLRLLQRLCAHSLPWWAF